MESFVVGLTEFFRWLLFSTMQVSVLVGLILVVKVILHRRLAVRWHYWLWLLLLVRMVMPYGPVSSFSVFTLLSQVKEAVVTDYVADESSMLETANITSANVASEIINSTEALQESEIVEPGAVETSYRPSKSSVVSGWLSYSVVEILSMVWLVVAVGLAGFALLCNFRLWRIVKSQRLLTHGKVLDLLEDCKAAMGIQTILGVVVTDKVNSPALFGVIRPRLLLPKGMLKVVSLEELRFVFLHELAHLKRHDIYLGWVMVVLQVLHWFNPLVWFAFGRMRADRELACDGLVLATMGVDKSPAYGQTLLNIFKGFSGLQYSPGIAGILEDKSQLKRRITMIAGFKKGSYRWSVLAVVLLAVLGFVALTNAEGPVAVKKEPAVLAKEFVDMLVKEDFAGAVKTFDKTMTDFLPASKLKDTWQATVGGAGMFGKQLGVREEKFLAFEIAIVTCEFETGPLDVKVTYDYKGQVAGLMLLPTPSEVLKGYREQKKPIDAKLLVENFFKNNYRDITVRKDIKWGEPKVDDQGNVSIRYIYEATIRDKEKIIENRIFTFDKNGKFVSVEKIEADLLGGFSEIVDDEYKIDSDIKKWEIETQKSLTSKLISWLETGNASDGKEADRLADSLLREEGGSAKAYFVAAQVANIRNNPDKAISILEDVISKYPNRKTLQLNIKVKILGNCWIAHLAKQTGNKEKMESAYEFIRENLEQQKGKECFHAGLNLYWAEMLESMGDNKKALEYLKSLKDIKKPKEHDMSAMYYIYTEWAQFKYDELRFSREQAVKNLTEYGFNTEDSYYMAASHLLFNGLICEIAGDNNQKKIHFILLNRAIENDLGSIDASLARLWLGFDSESNKNFSEAEKHYSALTKEDPYFSRIAEDAIKRCKKMQNENYEADVSSKLDIAIEDIDITPSDEEGLYAITVAIRNNGSEELPKFRFNFYVGNPDKNINLMGKPMRGSYYEAGPIKPNGVWNAKSLVFALRDGGSVITVILDTESKVIEFDETNNQAKLDVNVENGEIIGTLKKVKKAKEAEIADVKVTVEKAVKETKKTVDKQDKSLTEKYSALLEERIDVSADKGPDSDKLSAQYAVAAVCEKAGIPYNWNKSVKFADPERRRFVKPLDVKSKPAKHILSCILKPVGLSYELDEEGLYLCKDKSSSSAVDLPAAKNGGSPKVVRTNPIVLSNDVSPELTEVEVTFTHKMKDKSWSWTGGGETFPELAGDIHYDRIRRTCSLPVKLKAGKVYWIGINSPSHKNFQTDDKKAAERYVILFATKGKDGKPTVIPQDLAAKAKRINAKTQIRSNGNTKKEYPKLDAMKMLDEETRGAIENFENGFASYFKVDTRYELADDDEKKTIIEEWKKLAVGENFNRRVEAIAALGNVKAAEGVAALITVAEEPMGNNRPKWMAVRGLGEIGDAKAVPTLIGLVDHGNKNVKVYARLGLARITGVYFGDDKGKWKRWWMKNRRKFVVKKPKVVKEVKASLNIAGKWWSVDFVKSPDRFEPGIKQWRGDLFFKEVEFYSRGNSSFGWKWKNGILHDLDSGMKFPYYVEELDGVKYLFLPWINGDVKHRGAKPSYYVMIGRGK